MLAYCRVSVNESPYKVIRNPRNFRLRNPESTSLEFEIRSRKSCHLESIPLELVIQRIGPDSLDLGRIKSHSPLKLLFTKSSLTVSSIIHICPYVSMTTIVLCSYLKRRYYLFQKLGSAASFLSKFAYHFCTVLIGTNVSLGFGVISACLTANDIEKLTKFSSIFCVY